MNDYQEFNEYELNATEQAGQSLEVGNDGNLDKDALHSNFYSDTEEISSLNGAEEGTDNNFKNEILDEETLECNGSSTNELREQSGGAKLAHREEIVDGSASPITSEDDLLVVDFILINGFLNKSTISKMIDAGITSGQAAWLADETDHRRIRCKFICDRMEGLNSQEFAMMLGMKSSNAIYKHIDSLNKQYAEDGFFYDLTVVGGGAHRKAPTREEADEALQRAELL